MAIAIGQTLYLQHTLYHSYLFYIFFCTPYSFLLIHTYYAPFTCEPLHSVNYDSPID